MWMLRACEAMESGMETRLSLDSEFENFPAAHNRPYMHIKFLLPTYELGVSSMPSASIATCNATRLTGTPAHISN